jgi:hypothetical protein
MSEPESFPSQLLGVLMTSTPHEVKCAEENQTASFDIVNVDNFELLRILTCESIQFPDTQENV